ncbi:hypothetical protein [Rhizobium alarense]|nr:hypothetical protein [Rhizobium alarense]
MALAFLCLTMFVLLTVATLNAVRSEHSVPASLAERGKWIR